MAAEVSAMACDDEYKFRHITRLEGGKKIGFFFAFQPKIIKTFLINRKSTEFMFLALHPPIISTW